jgi:hypothetical protein
MKLVLPLLTVLILAAGSHSRLYAQDLSAQDSRVSARHNRQTAAPARNVRANNLVYVDKEGVLRWTKTNREAAFFGVNYTVPFAYSYRAHKALHEDLENAIRQDVYHMARLGLDAFRVHVWDTEISDSLGNLLENDHLRLFDFLLAELEKRNIKIIMTPIAFWGNGYPESDERTPGFSRVFGKGRATANDTAIRAQENYLRQLFRHVNTYTHRTYVEDPNVLAVELNNEPSHSGPKSGVTDYINRLAAAIRGVGWTKPLYYNISQSPYYADAVAKANIDGVSFQWYPTGLVAGAMQKGNFLPNVDRYVIPYDTIPAFRTKTRMVYEFETADVLQSDLYPAVARSFRAAGFQWATQFAYDPMALAYANTEYQTHYLNLAYTPSKAISLLIASEVFHTLPRSEGHGVYPNDTLFGAFHVSYREDLSEMNTNEKFYYTNNTGTKPLNSNALTNIAGVGSSPVVRYQGSGAYFLDKVREGVWRLEVMPDAVPLRDPFARPSPDREVVRVQWDNNPMQILLPDLGDAFTIKGLNDGNHFAAVSGAAFSGAGGISRPGSFTISPGTYLLVRASDANSAAPAGAASKSAPESAPGTPVIGLTEFAAPQPYDTGMFLHHEPFTEVSAGKSFTISADAAGIDTGRLFVQIGRLGGRQSVMLPMVRKTATAFMVEVPADLVTPGELNYRIIMEKGADYAVFPGDWKGDPFAWYNDHDETWKTFVAAEDGRLEIFDPTVDRDVWLYPGFRRNFQSTYITGEVPGRLSLKLAVTELSGDHTIGFQYGFTDRLRGRKQELPSFDQLIIRAKTGGAQPVRAKVTLTNADAFSYSAYITLTDTFQDIEVPLKDMAPDSAWIMPRPYPGFQPLWFQAGGAPPPFTLADMEKIQVTIGGDLPASEFHKPLSLLVSSIWLQKKSR